MDVSVIIVNYKTPKLLGDCLKSVREKTEGVEYEVIVVDNDSQDDSCQMVKRDFPWVKLIESKENLGFGRANNLGYKYTSGKYIFLLNSDTLLVNNAIKILYDLINRNKHIGICGGQLYDENYNKAHSYMLYYPSISWEINTMCFGIPQRIKHALKSIELKRNKCFCVSYITGADMMLRRGDIDLYGFFDSDFFLYYEETELTKRFYKRGGIKSYFCPDAKIIHLEGKSMNISLKKELIIKESRNLYLKKHHTRIYRIIYNRIFLFARYFTIVKSKILNNSSLYHKAKIEISAFNHP